MLTLILAGAATVAAISYVVRDDEGEGSGVVAIIFGTLAQILN